MDKEKIIALEEKRKLLKEEIRLIELRKRVKSQLTFLQENGHNFNIYYDFENINWINSYVKVRPKDDYYGVHGDFQIDVDDFNVTDIINLKENDIYSDKFAEYFSSIIPKNNSLIVCHLGGDPELEISIEAFLSNTKLFLSNPETWVITKDKNWIIECFRDQSVIRFIQILNLTPTLVKKIIIE